MFRVLLLFVIGSCISFPASQAKESDYKLELVQAMFRHGQRTPLKVETYPNDPYKGLDYKPYGHGQLTSEGMKTAYNIGKLLRKRYGTFLSQEYNAEELHAYSTPSYRTKMTLRFALASLYYPQHDVTFNGNISWVPVPIESHRDPFDFIRQPFFCPKYILLLGNSLFSSETDKKLEKFKDFETYLTSHTGSKLGFQITSFLVYYALHNQLNYNLTLPAWCTPKAMDQLADVVAVVFDTLAPSTEMKKLAAGGVIKKFISNIEESESKGNTKKLYLYSAHDLNVLVFLRAHNIMTPRIIEAGCTMVLEKLRGKDNQVYVRILIWPSKGDEFIPIKLDGCDEICPLAKYLEITKPIIPSPWSCNFVTKGYDKIKQLIELFKALF